MSGICNYFTLTMTLSVDRSSCLFLIRHVYCSCRYIFLKKKKKDGEVGKKWGYACTCLCPLGLLGAGRFSLSSSSLSSSSLSQGTPSWTARLQEVDQTLLSLLEEGYSNDTLHHTRHKTTGNLRHYKTIGTAANLFPKTESNTCEMGW